MLENVFFLETPDFQRNKGMNRFRYRHGFSLIELLVVVAVIATLVSLLLPAINSARARAKSVVCQSQMRQIILATQQYAQDYSGFLPRSTHSVLSVPNQMPWGCALYCYINGCPYTGNGPEWDRLFNGLYRCPADARRTGQWSYGLNSFLELTSLENAGRTWTRVDQMPMASQVIVYGELKSSSEGIDHIMANFWKYGGIPEVDKSRHGTQSNYAFLDGHVESLPFENTYDPVKIINRWDPELIH